MDIDNEIDVGIDIGGLPPMAQQAKNPPTMQKTQVQFLGQKDLLEKEWNGSPLQYSCLENAMDREAWQTTVHGVTKSWT